MIEDVREPAAIDRHGERRRARLDERTIDRAHGVDRRRRRIEREQLVRLGEEIDVRRACVGAVVEDLDLDVRVRVAPHVDAGVATADDRVGAGVTRRIDGHLGGNLEPGARAARGDERRSRDRGEGADEKYA